jgi:acyl carrier protein
VSDVPSLDELAAIVRAAASAVCDVPLEEVTLESHLYLDLGMDSLSFVEIVMELEESLDVNISDDRATEIMTVIGPPRIRWRLYRAIANTFLGNVLDRLRFSRLLFYREQQIVEFSKAHGVEPFSLGLMCVCVQEFILKVNAENI